MLSVIYAECQLCWVSQFLLLLLSTVLLSLVYSECPFSKKTLNDECYYGECCYAEYHLCWVTLTQSAICAECLNFYCFAEYYYAECCLCWMFIYQNDIKCWVWLCWIHLCWVSFMLSTIMLSVFYAKCFYIKYYLCRMSLRWDTVMLSVVAPKKADSQARKLLSDYNKQNCHQKSTWSLKMYDCLKFILWTEIFWVKCEHNLLRNFTNN